MLVVDTNIFIAQLGQLRQLAKVGNRGSVMDAVVIYIPWAVLRELDALKGRQSNAEGTDLGKSARAAINFVHELLRNNSRKVSASRTVVVVKTIHRCFYEKYLYSKVYLK